MRKTKLFSFNLAQKKLGGAGRSYLNKLVVFVAAFLSKMSKKIRSLQILERGEKS